MSSFDREARPNLPAEAYPAGQPGQHIVRPGNPRYCWNPFRHDSHEFHYTLDDGLTGSYACTGQPASIAIVDPQP